MSAVYLDHHATTPLDPRVADAMQRVPHALGNPSSPHGSGRRARALLTEAREQVAAAVGAKPADVVFTSGGTEACNLGVLGLLARTGRIVTTPVEHPAVLEPIVRTAREVAMLALPGGRLPDDTVVRAIVREAPCALFAVQSVNHETGTLFPVERWCALAGDALAPTFVDATQALGKVGIDLDAWSASAVALASHKIGGPAGAGALVVRRGASLEPQMVGGAQERGLRAGTPDVRALVGFGAACALLGERLAAQARVAAQRDRLEAHLIARGARPHGEGTRVATALNVSIAGWRSSALVAALDLEGLEISSGAACSSGVEKPSPVVRAMYPDDPERASSAIRISLGPETSDDDVARAIAIFDRVLARPPA